MLGMKPAAPVLDVQLAAPVWDLIEFTNGSFCRQMRSFAVRAVLSANCLCKGSWNGLARKRTSERHAWRKMADLFVSSSSQMLNGDGGLVAMSRVVKLLWCTFWALGFHWKRAISSFEGQPLVQSWDGECLAALSEGKRADTVMWLSNRRIIIAMHKSGRMISAMRLSEVTDKWTELPSAIVRLAWPLLKTFGSCRWNAYTS